MPATSKAQQHFMGMAHAIQKGDMPPSKSSPAVREAASTMKPGDVTDFAKTKSKGLPKHHHKKASIGSFDRLFLSDVLFRTGYKP